MLNPTKSATQQFLRTNWNWEQKLRLFVYQYEPHNLFQEQHGLKFSVNLIISYPMPQKI